MGSEANRTSKIYISEDHLRRLPYDRLSSRMAEWLSRIKSDEADRDQNVVQHRRQARPAAVRGTSSTDHGIAPKPAEAQERDACGRIPHLEAHYNNPLVDRHPRGSPRSQSQDTDQTHCHASRVRPQGYLNTESLQDTHRRVRSQDPPRMRPSTSEDPTDRRLPPSQSKIRERTDSAADPVAHIEEQRSALVHVLHDTPAQTPSPIRRKPLPRDTRIHSLLVIGNPRGQHHGVLLTGSALDVLELQRSLAQPACELPADLPAVLQMPSVATNSGTTIDATRVNAAANEIEEEPSLPYQANVVVEAVAVHLHDSTSPQTAYQVPDNSLNAAITSPPRIVSGIVDFGYDFLERMYEEIGVPPPQPQAATAKDTNRDPAPRIATLYFKETGNHEILHEALAAYTTIDGSEIRPWAREMPTVNAVVKGAAENWIGSQKC